MLGAVVAAIILLFALIKVLADDFTAFWAYVGLVLAAIVAVGAWLNVQEAGGVDSLRSEASGMKDAAHDDRRPEPPRPRTSDPSRRPEPTPPPPAPAPSPPPPAVARPDSSSPRTVAGATSPGSRSGASGHLRRTLRTSGRASPKAARKGRLLYSRRKASSTGTP